MARLAQQMPFREFAGAAVPKRLLNHGRNWEVFLDEKSLGFADGESEEAALRQVHAREVNNALYANSGDAPDWMTAEMPSPVVLAEYPEIAATFPDVLH